MIEINYNAGIAASNANTGKAQYVFNTTQYTLKIVVKKHPLSNNHLSQIIFRYALK